MLIPNLIRTVSIPHWRQNLGRTLLTIVGVSLGVATVVGVSDVSSSLLASSHHMVDAIAGPAQIELTNPGAGIDERLLEEIEGMSGVASAGALVEGFVPLADDPGEQVYLLGADFLGSAAWSTQFPRESIVIPDNLSFIVDPTSVVLPREFMQRRNLQLGDTLTLLVPAGPKSLTVRGVIEGGAPARLFGGALALMDLPAAQLLLAKERRLDRIAVVVSPQHESNEVLARIATLAGKRAKVDGPEGRGRRADQMLFTFRTTLMIMGLGAVIVGALIVFHTVTVSLHERQHALAILNAVGVPNRSLLRLSVAEAAVLAAAGGVLGIVTGHLLARFSSGLLGDVVTDIWFPLDATQHDASTLGSVVGFIMGLLTAVFAGYLAARATLAVPTVESLRPGQSEMGHPPRPWAAIATSSVLLAVVWLVIFAPPNLGFVETVTFIIGSHSLGYLAVAILAPTIVRSSGALARRAARGWTGFSLRLASENLPRSPIRGGATVASIAAAFSIAVVVTTFVASFQGSAMRWLQKHYAADLYVGRGDRVRLIAGPPMALDLGDRIQAIEGVQSVEPFRVIPVSLRGHPVYLRGLLTTERLAQEDLGMIEGDLASAAPALLAGTGVLISDNLSNRYDLHEGDVIELSTFSDTQVFRVEGVFLDYLASLDLGSIAVDFSYLQPLWRDRLANQFRVTIDPTFSATDVRSNILKTLGRAEGLYVLTATDFLDGVRSVIDNFFAATWALQLVTALVGVIGVVNAQVAAVLDRSREMTVLHAVGIPRRLIHRMIVLDCGMIGFLGSLAGLALGLMLGAQTILYSLRLVTGWQMQFLPPALPLLAAILVVTVISAAAGYVPARVSDRLTSLAED